MFLNGFLKLYLSRWSWGRLVVVREKHDYMWWYPRPPYGATQWHHPAASADSRRASPSGCPRSLPVKASLFGNASETVRAGRCPCLYDWKRAERREPWFRFFESFFGSCFFKKNQEEGEAEVGGTRGIFADCFEKSRRKTFQKNWKGSKKAVDDLFLLSFVFLFKVRFRARWRTRTPDFVPSRRLELLISCPWRTRFLISCQMAY